MLRLYHFVLSVLYSQYTNLSLTHTDKIVKMAPKLHVAFKQAFIGVKQSANNKCHEERTASNTIERGTHKKENSLFE